MYSVYESSLEVLLDFVACCRPAFFEVLSGWLVEYEWYKKSLTRERIGNVYMHDTDRFCLVSQPRPLENTR